jgi:hypothetical protein
MNVVIGSMGRKGKRKVEELNCKEKKDEDLAHRAICNPALYLHSDMKVPYKPDFPPPTSICFFITFYISIDNGTALKTTQTLFNSLERRMQGNSSLLTILVHL